MFLQQETYNGKCTLTILLAIRNVLMQQTTAIEIRDYIAPLWLLHKYLT